MGRVRRSLLGLSLVAASLFAVVGVANADRAPVGGPPTIKANRCDDFIRPCGDPLVLGTVRTYFDGPVEVVGMSSGPGPCAYFDNLRHGAGAGYCSRSLIPDDSKQIEPSMALQPTRRSTEITGELTGEVNRVQVTFRKKGSVRKREAHIVNCDVLAAAHRSLRPVAAPRNPPPPQARAQWREVRRSGRSSLSSRASTGRVRARVRGVE